MTACLHAVLHTFSEIRRACCSDLYSNSNNSGKGGQAVRFLAGMLILSFLVLAGPLLSRQSMVSAQGITLDGADFGSVTLGNPTSGQVVVSNGSNSDVTVLNATISLPPHRGRHGGNLAGSTSSPVFTVANASFPMTIFAGQSVVWTITFSPTDVVDYSGSLILITDAPDSPNTSQLTGSGITDTSGVAQDTGSGPAATGLLTANSASLNFRNAAIGSSSALVASITNVGNADVTVTGVSIAGAGFNASGLYSGLVLSPGQSASLSVSFMPSATGISAGALTITSDAVGLPIAISLSGNGTQAAAHSVMLSWTPSTTVVSSYNMYRSGVAGGPYARVNATPINDSQYTDSTAEQGQTYFYVATCMDSASVESAYSDEVSATVPGI